MRHMPRGKPKEHPIPLCLPLRARGLRASGLVDVVGGARRYAPDRFGGQAVHGDAWHERELVRAHGVVAETLLGVVHYRRGPKVGD